MNKKIFISIIVAVTLLILVSISSAVNVNTDDNKDIELLDNGEIEKISFIGGICTSFESEGLLGYRNVELWSFAGHGIDISGVTSYIPFRWYNVEDRGYMKAPMFIGFITVASTGRYLVRGIAFGNIEWGPYP